ncbi:Spy/CpxP family protein refolding chaperone [Thiomonas sp. FB-Cd]|uniref:Spy/CpxP family protein refolding chaperone n=1 Tax=Thiomonas sp. FB-Cd TaxID=1158292 RepID=UPI0018CC2E2E|nr:Spy/CpxP family protein refolding chaperone [Thiomonas sp. FB-Cd]
MSQNAPTFTLRKYAAPWRIVGAFALGLCLQEGTAMAQNTPSPPEAATVSPAVPSTSTGVIRCHWRGHGVGPRMQALLHRVHATPEQRERIRGLRNTMMENNRPLMQQMRTVRGDRMRLLAAPTIDRGALETMRGKQMRLSDELSKNINQMQYEIAEVLTPAQRQEIYRLIDERQQHCKKNGGYGPMRRGAGYRQ